MNNSPDFIRQFDGKFEDGLSVSLRAFVQPPLPSQQIGEGMSVGEGETGYSQTDNPH